MKSKTKRILAFLCAVVLFVTAVFTENAMNQAQAETGASAEETSTEPTPVELYGFQNVTLNGLVSATDNSVMTDKEYASGEYTYKLNNDTHFDKKLFTALVEFTDSDMNYWWNNRICIGGTAGNGWGLSVALTNNGKSLMVCDADGTKIATPQISQTIEDSAVEVDSFLGTEILLQMGYEYLDCDNDGKQNDVRILVYVNGKEGLNTIVKDCVMETLGNYVRVSISNTSKIGINSVDLPVKPVELDGFTNVNPSDVVYEGTTNPMDEKTYTSNQFFTLSGEENFNKKLFTAYVKPSNSGNYWDWRICLGGTSAKWGVALCAYASGDTLSVEEFDSDVDGSSTSFSKQISAATANVNSFVTKPFLLQMGLEYLDNDGGGTENDVRVLIYVNGNAVFNEIFSNCNMNNLGNYLRFYIQNGSIEVSSFESEAKPVTLSSHDTITISDFQDSASKEMEAKAYAYDSVAPDSTFTLKNTSDNFANKLLSMKVKFGYESPGDTNYDSRMVIGADNVWSGIFVYVDKQDQLCFDNMVNSVKYERITIAEAGVSSFLNTPFILQLSFTDTSDGLNVDVFINGTLCKTFTWSGVATSQYNNQIHLRRNVADSFIVISDVDADEFPADPVTMPDSSFEKITFGSFAMMDGTYSANTEDYTYNGSLHKKVLCGKIKLEGDTWFNIRLGGNTNTWDTGLYLAPLSGGQEMEVKWRNGGLVVKSFDNFTSDIAGVKFVGQEYDLMISLEVVDANEDGVNDVRFGIWFDNKLYGDQYYTAEGVGDNLGSKLALGIPAGTITLNSVKEYLPQPSKDLEKVTFEHFGVEDGTYVSLGDGENVKGSYGTTVDGTVLCGDVQLHNANAGGINICLGFTDNIWTQGVRLSSNYTYDILQFIYQTTDGVQKDIHITSAAAGVDFFADSFNLMWSMEMVDNDGDSSNDDLKVGLWFDGFQYNGDYIYFDNFGEGKLGNGFATQCATGTSITLGSDYDLPNLPDKNFDKITFSDFGLSSQAVECNDNVLYLGTAKKDTKEEYANLDKVVFSGDFRFTVAGTYQIKYASNNAGATGWNGLTVLLSETAFQVFWVNGTNNGTPFINGIPSEHLTSPIKNTFNLMISTEIVDADGNGVDDIKVGVWVNKALCGNQYYIVNDLGSALGNQLAIYGPTGNTVMIRNEAGYQRNPYYYDEIAEYRGAEKTYPTEQGYVFSGWYADSEYKTPIEPDETSGHAWAKFVEDDVLSVKPQIKVVADGSDADTKPDLPSDTTDLRMATTVDNLEYRRISFFVQKEKNGSYGAEFNTATTDENARMVYEKLYAIGNKNEVWTYKPTSFSWQSDYFKTFTLTGIPASDYDTMLKITPYWITMDGTLVRGKALEICVNDYVNNKSQAVSVDFIGDDTLPITGFNGPYVVSNANDAKLFPNYISDEYFKMIADSGVNVIMCSELDYNVYPNQVKKALELGEKYGIGLYIKDGRICPTKIDDDTWNVPTFTEGKEQEEIQALIKDYSDYESFVGIYLIDEPSDDNHGTDSTVEVTNENLARISKALTALGYLTYTSAFPSNDLNTHIFNKEYLSKSNMDNYISYVNTLNSQLNTTVLMWDMYPFKISGSETEVNADKKEYFWNMGEIRKLAQSTNKPFWAFVQAGSNWNDDRKYYNSQVYAPTEGQFKWNMNTALAFGAQGIQYFPLIQPNHFAYAGSSADDNMWDFERNGLIGAFGNKTEWYYYAQEANAHVGAMDHILMNSYNEKIIAIGDAENDMNYTYHETLGATQSGNVISGVEISSSVYNELASATGDAIIGCFDYKGKTALYVVNYDYGNAGIVTLNFDGSQSITVIEDAKERTENVSTLILNMEAGEGILLVIE